MSTKQEKLIKLDEYLDAQRTEWTTKIRQLAEDLKHGNNLEEVSAYTLSYRQIMVEQLASIGTKIRSQKSACDRLYKQKWLEYYNYDYKLTDKQKERFLDADMADDKHMLELLETQKAFLEGSVKTLDNMGFAIKNRLDISKL
jgi:hypothetical protein